MKSLRIIVWLALALFAISLIAFIIVLCTCKSNIAIAATSASLSITTSIAFGFYITYYFQNINDNRKKNFDIKIIEAVREKEFAKIKDSLANFVKSYYLLEKNITTIIPSLTSSFTNNDIDIENLSKNIYIFYKLNNNIEFLDDKEDIQLLQVNIDELLMQKPNQSRTYKELETLLKNCEQLYETMSNDNIEYKLDVFTKEEIKTFVQFANRTIDYLIIQNTPYAIIQIFKNILKIEEILKVDFEPYILKGTIVDDLNKWDQSTFDEIDSFNNKFDAIATDFIKTLK